MRRKAIALVMSFTLFATALSGCGKKDDSKKNDTTEQGSVTKANDDGIDIDAYIDSFESCLDPEEGTLEPAEVSDDYEIDDRSNSKLIKYTKISPNRSSPRNHKIDTITIHCTGGQLTTVTIGNIFGSSRAQASANYGIGMDGEIGLYVEEKDRSWCSSNAANDNRAITIEVSSDSYAPYAVNDAAYESLIKLLVDICKRNDIKKLVWSDNKDDRINHKNGCNMTVHRDFANKACPGDYLYERMGEIADAVNEQLGAK